MNNIYISTSCVKTKNVVEAIELLCGNGFNNIELSGDFVFYDDMPDDLLTLKGKYNISYLCHNYFPASSKHFVLNLASLSDEIYEDTLEHLKRAVRVSRLLGSKKYGFHAGYFIDITIDQIGKKISYNNLFDRNESMRRFCDGFNLLKEEAEGVELYIENNVLSSTNKDTFKPDIPFMLTHCEEYLELKESIDFKLLLDVGHLKVSANSLKLDYHNELDQMIQMSDYIHLSENDGLHDQNCSLTNDIAWLKKYDLKSKTLTLEIYDTIDKIRHSYDLIEGAMK